MGSEEIAMQGMMMKKKSKSGLLSSKWVMRYFILHRDGKLVYYHEKTETGAETNNNKKSEVLCNNVGECTIDVVKASDLAGRVDSVANSFYITGKGRSKGAVQRTLLVTNGPNDFKRWMLAFQNMKAEMLHGVDSGVKDDENDISPKKDEANIPLQISFNSAEVKTPQDSSPDEKPTVALQQSVRFAADVDIKSKEDQEDAKSVTFSFQDAQLIREAVSGDDKSVTFSERSVTFSDRDDVISGDRSVTFSDYDSEIILDGGSGDERSGGAVTFSDYEDEIIIDAIPGDERSVTFSDRDDVISGDRSVTFSDHEDEIILDAAPNDESVVNGVSWKDEVIEIRDAEEVASAVEEADETAAKEEAPAEVIEKHQDEDVDDTVTANEACQFNEKENFADKIKVFKYGDHYDDMTEALDGDKVLFGIITTSVEELLDDEAYVETEPKPNHSELTPILIQYTGSEVDYFKNNEHEIKSLCDRFCSDEGLISVVYSSKVETRNRILSLMGEAHQDEVSPVVTPDSPSKVPQKAAQLRTMRVVDTGGLTAYKHALNVQGADVVPDGPALLRIVREPMGTPYNWVLFKPSKEELLIEDGGSGGVMELAEVVHRDYNDQVLFGLARVSFAGDFGLRQFWCALEWKGENASGVKALRAYNDCLAPMADLIGDRSFTLSNSSAMDLSPQIVVDFVKKSCNVEFLGLGLDMTVQALERAHEKEQKAIEEYWDKLEAKEKAKQDAIAEKLKREEEEREARLKIRTNKLAEAKDIREKRKNRWSKMNTPDLLEDLGKLDLSGWVLLQVDLEK
eukprot:scaffold790_cov149-Skeletonema_menzelii.AAC.2